MSLPTRDREPPWGWIGACGVLLVIAVCLLIWALQLQSDLDDQKAATRRAQEQARTAGDRLDDVSTQLDRAKRTLDDVKRLLRRATAGLRGSLGGIVDDLERRIEDLSERASGALSDLGGGGSP